ncbi:ribonuclease H-like domain-containing protein [Myxozyma melibiosi]|uniref:Ribonuclease H-like domain-containing protein n=1 Tax=Myxozyma melibiosi TaxID=54550 RepID=A0ABR1EZ98_9ASCO
MTESQSFELQNQAILTAVLKTTQAASKLAAQDLGYYKTLGSDGQPELNKKLDGCSKRLVGIANALLEASGVGGVKVEGVKELTTRWKEIGDVNDTLFEKTDTYLDSLTNDRRKPLPIPATQHQQPLTNKRKRGMLDPSVLNADIEKPQLKFKNIPDNFSTAPFKPLLTSKPNAKVSLEESLQLTYPSDGAMPEYKNPYLPEITSAKFPKRLLKITKAIEPMPLETTEPIWVDDMKGLKEMLRELQHEDAIAVDLEHHDARSYIGIVCLMQISTRSNDFLIDTLKLRSELQILNKVFTDPKIVKVFHGSSMDVIWLQRDLGLYLVCLFDTYYAARALQLQGKSLAFLLDMFCGFTASKEYQLADWRIRPLTKEMAAYARCDTHFLLNIFDKLRNKLVAENKLEVVLANSREECTRTYKTRVYDDENGTGMGGWLALREKFNILRPEDQPLLRALTKWRDTVAREQDDGVNYVLSNRSIFNIIRSRPVDPAGVYRAVGKSVNETIQRRVDEIIQIVKDTDPANEKNQTEAAAEAAQTKEKETEKEEKKEVGKSGASEIQAEDETEHAEYEARRLALAKQLFENRDLGTHVKQSQSSQLWGSVF